METINNKTKLNLLYVIDDSMDFEKISIRPLTRYHFHFLLKTLSFNDINFSNIEEFKEWLNNDSKDTNIKKSFCQCGIFCSWDTQNYLQKNLIYKSNQHSFTWVEHNINDFLESDIICFNSIKEWFETKIKNIDFRQIKVSIDNKELYKEKILVSVLHCVNKMKSIEELLNKTDDVQTLSIFLENWILLFYEISHNPKWENKYGISKCHHFYKKYFPDLYVLNPYIDWMTSYVYCDKKSWVYKIRNQGGVAHTVDVNNAIKSNTTLKQTFVCDFSNKNANIYKFVSLINSILLDLLNLYSYIHNKLIGEDDPSNTFTTYNTHLA